MRDGPAARGAATTLLVAIVLVACTAGGSGDDGGAATTPAPPAASTTDAASPSDAAVSVDEQSPDGPSDDVTADGTGPDEDGAARPSPAIDDPALADAAFLTAVDEVMAGTEYERVVDADPGGFLVLATTICELLGAGVPADGLLDATLVVMGATAEDADPELATLSGSVVGAAVEVYCPSEADALAELGGE